MAKRKPTAKKQWDIPNGFYRSSVPLSEHQIVGEVVPQKRCLVCQEWYPATPEFFPRRKARRNGLYPYCKECTNANNRARYERKTPLPEVLPEGFKQCTECKEVKLETEKYFFRASRGGFRSKCKVCHSTKAKIYNAEHAEEQKVQGHQRYLKNIEGERKKSHLRYINSIEYYRQRNQRYNQSGAAKMYRQAHPEIARASNRKRRSLKRASGSFTTKQIREQHQRQKGRCYYCNKEVGKNYHIEHVMPLSRGGSNDISNIVIACPTCNMRKQDKLPHEWPEGGRLL